MGKPCCSEDLSTETITQILQEHYNDASLKVLSVNGNEKFLAKNDNFNSEIKRWNVQFTQESDDKAKEVSFIVKASREGSLHRFISPISPPFVKEVFWFKIAHPELTKLYPELSTVSPGCYYGYTNYLDSFLGRKKVMQRLCCVPCWPFVLPEETGLLLLENLCTGNKNLKLLDKTAVFTLKQMTTLMKTLAVFHGVWLKWDKESCKHENFSGDLKHEHLKKLKVGIKPWMIGGMMKSTMKSITCLLRNQQIDDDIVKRWEEYGKTRMMQRAGEFLDTEKELSKSKIVTVCHGDVWSNNMLFTEDDESVTLIDFQMLGRVHPALDLWYFLAVNSDKELRMAHLPELLRNYFDVFQTYLKDVQIEMTFEEFSKEVYERRDIMLSFGTLTMPNVLSPNEIEWGNWDSFSKLNRKREIEIGGLPTPEDHPMVTEIRRRLVGIVLEAAETNFI